MKSIDFTTKLLIDHTTTHAPFLGKLLKHGHTQQAPRRGNGGMGAEPPLIASNQKEEMQRGFGGAAPKGLSVHPGYLNTHLTTGLTITLTFTDS